MPSSRPVSLRGLGRALLQLAGIPAIVVVCAVAVLMLYDTWMEHDERGQFPPPGTVVDIGGGQHMHLQQWGAGNPGPTIVLTAGAAIPSSAWEWFGRDLGDRYHVVGIDRPGMGWSSGGSGPRDAATAAKAIHAALAKAAIPPPYIIGGHSLGGFTARVFVSLYPTDVAAAILLDSSHPDAPGSGYGFIYRMQALRGHLGLFYLFPPDDGYASLPADAAAATYAVSRWTSHLDGSADELDAWNTTTAEARSVTTFGALPLLVVSTPGNDTQVGWERDLAGLSSRSQFVILNVGHTSMLSEPDQAALVSQQISQFLAANLR